MYNDSDEMIHSDRLLNHLTVFFLTLQKRLNTFKEFFAWENSLTNLNTLKWKCDPVLAAKKMSSVGCFPLHSVFPGPGALACEWSWVYSV